MNGKIKSLMFCLKGAQLQYCDDVKKFSFDCDEGQKKEKRVVNGEVVKFNYSEVVVDHYRYRRAVGNHNALGDYFRIGGDGRRGGWVPDNGGPHSEASEQGRTVHCYVITVRPM